MVEAADGGGGGFEGIDPPLLATLTGSMKIHGLRPLNEPGLIL